MYSVIPIFAISKLGAVLNKMFYQNCNAKC